MTAPLQYGTEPPSDPTGVMGRRTLAWLADLVLYAVVVAVGLATMVEYVDIPPGIAVEDACGVLEAQQGELPGGCFAYEDRLYLLDDAESNVQTMLSLGWFVVFVVLQGVAGGSPGKLLFGLRVVDQYGNKAGIGKSLGRTLLWVVDGAPWLVPLVGPITALTSTGHRRVGDLAAGTYVVSASRVGSPVMPTAAAPPSGQPSWGAAPPTAPTGPGWAPPAPSPAVPSAPATEQTPSPPEPDPWTSSAPEPDPWPSGAPDPVPGAPEPASPDDLGAPTDPVDEAPPTVHADPDWSRPPDDLDPTGPVGAEPHEPTWTAPTLPDVQEPSADWQPPTSPGPGPGPDWDAGPMAEPPLADPAPFAAPGSDGPAATPAPGPPAAPGSPRFDLPAPQWDAARNTYLQWDPNRQAWLQWDTAGERWKPIDT